jgi:hypothetical protein
MKYVNSAVVLFVLLIAAPAPARAGSIVVNGGFETGDFSDWTLNDPSLGTFVASAFGGYVPNSGQDFAALGASGLLGTVSQDLNTTAGATYTLDYFLANDGFSPNEFAVAWGGTTLFDQVNIPAQGYVEYTFQVNATGASTNLTFFEQDDNGFISLDDVSVTANAVPEPTSIIPLAAAVVVIGGYIFYRRGKRSLSPSN